MISDEFEHEGGSYLRSRELWGQTHSNAYRITTALLGGLTYGDHASKLFIPYNSHCRCCREEWNALALGLPSSS